MDSFINFITIWMVIFRSSLWYKQETNNEENVFIEKTRMVFKKNK